MLASYRDLGRFRSSSTQPVTVSVARMATGLARGNACYVGAQRINLASSNPAGQASLVIDNTD
jgi:hypothetical protein